MMLSEAACSSSERLLAVVLATQEKPLALRQTTHIIRTGFRDDDQRCTGTFSPGVLPEVRPPRFLKNRVPFFTKRQFTTQLCHLFVSSQQP